nr:CoB--CoM heterodisulfide reductase iron-sulfur subunit B family protein [Maliibacterium massiliense]
MIFSYYPGCTLKTKAKALDDYARKSAEALGVTLEELPEWQCCGGVYPMAKDEIATKLSSVRALKSARALGRDLVTMCSACHNVIKQVNHAVQTDEDMAAKVNNYMADETPYHGETRVLHFLEVLRDVVGFDQVKAAVKAPLAGQRIAPYYGCLLLRPGKVMAMDNPEKPTIMEDLLRALGAEPVTYPERNECCGGYVTLEDPALARARSSAVVESAKEHGAQAIITACPLCLYNLKKHAGEAGLPVLYFTELLAQALGVKE